MKQAKHNLVTDLRKAMTDSGLSLLQLAHRSTVGYSSVHGFARGYRDLTLQSAAKLADTLGLVLAAKPRQSKRKGR